MTMRTSVKLTVNILCLAAIAVACGCCLDSGIGQTRTTLLAARYHARGRTASFFQRAGAQGRQGVRKVRVSVQADHRLPRVVSSRLIQDIS